MTETHIEKVLEDIRPNIVKLARVFLGKMRQPPPYRLQDLEQEGLGEALAQIRKDQYKEDRGTSLKTYLMRRVLFRFIDLMHKSYKIDQPDLEERRVVTGARVSPKIEELSLLLEITESFNSTEMKYMNLMLSPPESIQKSFSKSKKLIRKTIREEIGISDQEERLIRESIRIKLSGGR